MSWVSFQARPEIDHDVSDAVEEWHQNHSENEGQPAAVVLEVWHVTQDQDHKEEGQAVNQVPHTFVVGPVNKVD